MGWENPPPVVLLSGSHRFFVRREVQNAIREAGQHNRRVVRITGREGGVVEDFLAETAVFNEKTLAVIWSPEKLDAGLIKEHAHQKDNTISMVLWYDGDFTQASPMGLVAKGIPKGFQFSWKQPAEYKLGEYAVEFVQAETRRQGKTIQDRLASALVTKSGTDFGVLSFEVLKAVAYANALGVTDLTADIVKGTYSSMVRASVKPVVESLHVGSAKGVLKALGAVKATSSTDPTLEVVAWVGNEATRWLHASALLAQGASTEEIQERLGVHPFILKSFILPVARRWGVGRLSQLVKDMATVERAAKSSHIDHWVELECVLTKACHSLRAVG